MAPKIREDTPSGLNEGGFCYLLMEEQIPIWGWSMEPPTTPLTWSVTRGTQVSQQIGMDLCRYTHKLYGMQLDTCSNYHPVYLTVSDALGRSSSNQPRDNQSLQSPISNHKIYTRSSRSESWFLFLFSLTLFFYFESSFSLVLWTNKQTDIQTNRHPVILVHQIRHSSISGKS